MKVSTLTRKFIAGAVVAGAMLVSVAGPAAAATGTTSNQHGKVTATCSGGKLTVMIDPSGNAKYLRYHGKTYNSKGTGTADWYDLDATYFSSKAHTFDARSVPSGTHKVRVQGQADYGNSWRDMPWIEVRCS